MLTSCLLAIAITTAPAVCDAARVAPSNPTVVAESYTPPDRKAPDNRKGGASR